MSIGELGTIPKHSAISTKNLSTRMSAIDMDLVNAADAADGVRVDVNRLRLWIEDLAVTMKMQFVPTIHDVERARAIAISLAMCAETCVRELGNARERIAQGST